MKIQTLIKTTISIAKIKLLGKRIPLVLTWPITNRCNLRCKYCEEWKKAGKELSTEEIKKIITELKSLGTVRISLSGGEPLIREDIGEIINYIKENDISVVITSNGTLVPEKIKEIRNADVVKLSIEGNEETHDKIRGEGSFNQVIAAANAITQTNQDIRTSGYRGIGKTGCTDNRTTGYPDSLPRLVFNSVLTAYNLDQIDFLIDLAKKYDTGVRFSVLSTSHASKERISPLEPEPEELIKALDKLIIAKKDGEPVLNSLAGLRYLKDTNANQRKLKANGRKSGNNVWRRLAPWFRVDSRKFRCFAGRAFAHLSSDGMLYPCVMLEGRVEGQDVREQGFEEAFKKLNRGYRDIRTSGHRGIEKTGYPDTRVPGCSGCFCAGTLEMNLLLNFKPRSIWSARKLI